MCLYYILQVCRLAYEIMQTLHPDASSRFHSLDDIYYYGGQNAHNQVALQEHKARNQQEIDLEIGDIVGIAGNHWDGYVLTLSGRLVAYCFLLLDTKFSAFVFATPLLKLDGDWR